MTFDDLLTTIEREGLSVDRDLLRLAFEVADRAHDGQVRLSGEPVITHPLAVAQKLALLHLDEETIIAGLLHDVPEDTAVTIDVLRRDFGDTVADLVEGVTKLGKLKYRGADRYLENLRRMFVAMARDIRVILIKFADRLHNLETLDALPQAEKRRRIALETLEIYAPIANRLGVGEVKGQLEDLAFPYVHPEEARRTTALMNAALGDVRGFIAETTTMVRDELGRHGVDVIDVHGRRKHLYSLWKKLQRPDIDGDLTKVHDLLALRIIVSNVTDCYAALGLIHGLWRPLPGRVKDYIAQPKPNGYRSLHTTVFGPHGRIIELQIRDAVMHDAAEYGIAAHWQYDEAGKPKRGALLDDGQLAWVRELTEWHHELEDERQALESLKIDVFRNRIFCFTPHGDVIDLPEGATAVDFAYAVHSDLGDHMSGVRINGKFEEVLAELKSGDVVEVVVDKHRPGPNEDWLEAVKTRTARERIKRAAKGRRSASGS